MTSSVSAGRLAWSRRAMPTSASGPINSPWAAADVGQWLGQGSQIKAPSWPVADLPDAGVIAAVHAEITGRILRTRKLFTVDPAEIEGVVHCT